MIIYMDDYRKAPDLNAGKHDRDDEQLQCVYWNPALRMLATSYYQTTAELSPQLPENFSNIDAEAFLDRAYALATQV